MARYTYYAIVASGPRVLLLPSGSGWSLPHVSREKGAHPYFGPLIDDFRDQLGLDLAVLRVVYRRRIAGATDESEMVLDCENRTSEAALPPGGRWMERRDLVGMDLTPPEDREVLQGWFDELDGRRAIPALRVPWARPGWLAEVESWIRARLDERGSSATERPAQVKTWSISCVLRVPTGLGPVYFKAVPPLFAGEPALTEALSRRHPGQIPRVLAQDSERGWLLLDGIHGLDLRRTPTLDVWAPALGAFARLQREYVGQAETRLASGVMDRRIAGLPDQLDQLLAELASPDLRAVYGVSEEDAARVVALRPRLKEEIAALAAAGVPDTLVHGDLHGGNVIVEEGRPIFFDWTDGALAHPFFDLLTLLGDPPVEMGTPEGRERLRDAYLEPWADMLPRERLLEGLALSQRVAPLYHALSYRHIARNTEPALHWELSDGVGDYLRLLRG